MSLRKDSQSVVMPVSVKVGLEGSKSSPVKRPQRGESDGGRALPGPSRPNPCLRQSTP